MRWCCVVIFLVLSLFSSSSSSVFIWPSVRWCVCTAITAHARILYVKITLKIAHTKRLFNKCCQKGISSNNRRHKLRHLKDRLYSIQWDDLCVMMNMADSFVLSSFFYSFRRRAWLSLVFLLLLGFVFVFLFFSFFVGSSLFWFDIRK